jgi:hypothetical protein
MDFDQMLEAWKVQDDKPLYGVNGDLLQLVLQNERAAIRRSLRWEFWTSTLLATGLAVWAVFWLWVLIYVRGPVLQIVAAAVGGSMLAVWVGAFLLSRRRQARRERAFGNTLRDEIGRSLSLVEYQLARFGRWSSAMLWSSPVVVGAGLVSWLMIEINLDPGESRWNHAWMLIVLAWAAVIAPYSASRAARRKLEPRRQRLRELLDALDAAE